MKLTLFLLQTLIFGFYYYSQEIRNIDKPKAQHSIIGSGGFYIHLGDDTDVKENGGVGWATELGYQVRFPNKFVFGLGLLTDQSLKKPLEGTTKNIEGTQKYSGLLLNVDLGVHAINTEKIDLMLFITPHYYFWRTKVNSHDSDKNITTNTTSTIGYYAFVPLLSYSIELMYKFTPSHAVGLTLNAHVSKDAHEFVDLFNIFFGAEYQVAFRGLLTYRFTI